MGKINKNSGRIKYLQVIEEHKIMLTNICMNLCKWENLPESVDERVLESTLATYGNCVYFRDNVLGDLVLPASLNGDFSVTALPKIRYVYSPVNDYHATLTEKDSVIIPNNFTFTPFLNLIDIYSETLTNIFMTMENNVIQQQTPYIILTNNKTLLSYKNLIDTKMNFERVIYADESLNMDGVKVLPTVSPYMSDNLEMLYHNRLNDFLSRVGISNINVDKKERLITDEASGNSGIVKMQRNTFLQPRQIACEKINKMFGTNISVHFNEPREEEVAT